MSDIEQQLERDNRHLRDRVTGLERQVRHAAEKVGQLELTKTALEQKLAYHPEPGTNPALTELHEFVGSWAKRHKLSTEEALHLQACLLSGRLSVCKSLAAVKALLPTHPDDEGWPKPVPKKLADPQVPLAFQQSDVDWLLTNAELGILLLQKYVEDKQKEKPCPS